MELRTFYEPVITRALEKEEKGEEEDEWQTTGSEYVRHHHAQPLHHPHHHPSTTPPHNPTTSPGTWASASSVFSPSRARAPTRAA